jgi:hypothetical protein
VANQISAHTTANAWNAGNPYGNVLTEKRSPLFDSKRMHSAESGDHLMTETNRHTDKAGDASSQNERQGAAKDQSSRRQAAGPKCVSISSLSTFNLHKVRLKPSLKNAQDNPDQV